MDYVIERITDDAHEIRIDFTPSPSEWRALADAMGRSAELYKLTLYCAEVTDGLVEALRRSTSLQSLELDGCYITDDTLIAVAEAVGRSESMLQFELNEHTITDGVCVALVDVFQNNTNLMVLGFYRCSMTDTGVFTLAEGLSRRLCTTWLKLWGVPVSSAARRAADDVSHRNAVYSRVAALLGCTGNTPAARFVRLDGDHAIATRVLRSMLK